MNKWKILTVTALFVFVLIGLRVFWIISFDNIDQPHAVNGELDLREWTWPSGHTITLDGEWEFYPHEWLIESDTHQGVKRAPFPLHVPGGWNDYMLPGESTPYGYGSYHLRILLNPQNDSVFSIRIPSVRSSSELFVNGRLLAQSGQPAANKEAYIARNVPYTGTFTPDGRGVVEIVVQAANYTDPRSGGIIRSMKFGSSEAITRETQISLTMQQIVAVAFLIHAIYGLTLFFMGYKDKKLLYFSLLVLCGIFSILVGSEDKILLYWFPVSLEWSLKAMSFFVIVGAFSLLQYVMDLLPAYWRTRILPMFTAICGAALISVVFLPIKEQQNVHNVFVLITALLVLLGAGSLFRTAIRGVKEKENVLLLLSLIAFTSNFVWMGVFIITGMKIVYYPFDLIASTVCSALVWIRRYFQVHSETAKLAAKLQNMDKRKDEFLANTSHELRNPLNSILNISQAVLERENHALSAKSAKDLELVLSVGRRMSLMLNDLLDTERLKESNPRLQLRNFSMWTVVTGVLDMFYLMTERKPVRLTNQIAENFPYVYADENRVVQIVFNLLHNAVKYTNEGEVTIRGYVQDGRAHIVISDTGIGIDKDMMQRIFEPYEQAHHDRVMTEGGFGLGLSISKQLVELHGGTLKAHSVPGKGSEFSFALRLADPSSAREEAETEVAASIVYVDSSLAAASTPHDTVAGQPMAIGADGPRILVVDDDPVNLKALENILSFDRYDITTVTSGSEALAILDSHEWDLLISDVMMPNMSGYELSRTIRQRFSLTELPILLLTARYRSQDIETGFLSGANDYVTKPVNASELRSRVQALTAAKVSVRERLRMEAAWLQAQIQPHFLFNTLNAVAALSEIDHERMRNLLETFGNFLRDKFKFKGMDEHAPIEDELSIVRSYLLIEQERFGDRLRVTWEIDECKQLMLPSLTIQPLVENAVKHGIMKRSHGGNIHIRLTDCDTYAEIAVVDDGVGMDEEMSQRVLARQSSTSGIGLLNTDLRLKRHYGKGLQINSKPGHGTSVSFIVYKHK
nr:ATP-binding protein [Paenibacillus thalictri]